MLIQNRNKVAFKSKNFSFTYAQILNQINYYSTILSEKKGNIIIFSENRPEYVFSLYAAWKNNCTVIPVDYLSTPDEFAYILNDSKPGTILTSAERKEAIEKTIELIDYKPEIIYFENTRFTDSRNDTVTGFDVDNYEDIALIIYTSGTTGSPKGVKLSFTNLLSNIQAVSDKVPIYTEGERVLMLLPLHHIFPLMGTVIIPFYAGCTVAMSPSLSSEDIISTLGENSISIIIGVPRLYNTIRKGIMDKIHASKIALLLYKLAARVNSQKFSKTVFKTVHKKFGGSLKYLVSGGAAINKDVVRDFQILGFEVLEGYGMSEAAPMISFTRPGRIRLGAAGEAVPGVSIEIRDGEIVAKGKNIMNGYYNKPEETREVVRDGWLYTGDLGHLDEEGYLYITGRKKDIIILSNGKNINPEEIEIKIEKTSPAVKEAGIFAMNDTLNAVIYPDFTFIKNEPDEDYHDFFRWNVIDVYNNEASSYKKIHGLILVNEELPKTRLGKIKHFELEKFSVNLKRKRNEEQIENFQEFEILKKFLDDQFEKEVQPSDHIEMDLAIDSLGLVSLSVFVHSTFGLNMKEAEFAKFDSVLKIAEFIREHRTKINVENIQWSDILKVPFNSNILRPKKGSSVLRYAIKIFLKSYFRIKAEGLSNLPDSPCIITPNHQSIFDAFFLNAILKNKLMKKTYFYAKEKHFQQGWLKKIADYHNVIVMEKNVDLRLSIQNLAEILKKGRNVVIFPEGTRSADGTLGNFKKTFAILSQELNIPVVPVIIHGSKSALPVGSWFPRPFSKIKIRVLQPVYPLNHSYESLQQTVQRKIELGLNG